ncbi:TetR/AcrR family transcriptional regulator [Virgibacillus salexigens]|uniref:HTH-type transcriptional repressor KstR2 n=2 Tax=Virgibacillus TaxID=84406 RepID=A0A024QHU6_9BACI|nr:MULTISPECIES: TetR/AcrR family transcriptional regulator [Virgibacillus]GGJ65693.1 hypothetical protein GCM10007111_29480 [Virgibacillus kapii]CDQ42069.1 HTH-type transcriptional repressor KstR2 [Virgibacillus massiliensis]
MKAKIMIKSIDLFDEKGFTETSIQDIVDSIDATKGTFYYYFTSKQELLRDIHLTYIHNLLKEQAEIINDSSKNVKEKLYTMIYSIINKIETQGKYARIIFREMRHLDDANLEQIKQKRKEFRLNFEKLIQEGVDKGEFQSQVRTDILSFAILGMVNRTYYWFQPDGELSEEELTDLYMEMILNGIN